MQEYKLWLVVDDAGRLVEKLMGRKKQLQIVSVVGMAGLGKRLHWLESL